MSEIKKVVLAYSGGLDTSIIIPWLKENYNNPEIIAVAADVGQGDELEGLEAKAIKTGASKLYVEDLVDEMVDSVVIPSMMMGAKYEDYLLGTAFARPIIGKRLVEIAKKEGADAIAHGCTGKGNDQVRFELAIKYSFSNTMTTATPGGVAWTKMGEVKHEWLPKIVMMDNFDDAWEQYMEVYSACKPEDFISEMQAELDRRVAQ